MRQAATSEKIDPLMRIQEEIKEVVRREQEYRQLVSGSTSANLSEYETNNEPHTFSKDKHCESITSPSVLITPVPVEQTKNKDTENSPNVRDEVPFNTPSLTSSVNSRESLDDHHSDDSGISASSIHINRSTSDTQQEDLKTCAPLNSKEHRYIGPNCYNMTPDPPQQRLMTRTVSTPHLSTLKPRQFAFSPAHKGVMQRFIASRGKIQLNNSNGPINVGLSSRNSPLMTNLNTSVTSTPSNTPLSGGNTGASLTPDFEIRNPAAIIISTVTMTPSVIERDADGRPIRRGYIPVEVKIQRELKDLKTRESELKKIRKIRQSSSDLLEAEDNDNENSGTDEDGSEIEHCYGPGKLRSAKSINELCTSTQYHNISPRATPSPDFESSNLNFSRQGGMRPALSLAQLCDLDPEEAPSSHRLIAQWESLIQQNA